MAEEVPLLQVTSVRFVVEDRYLLLADSENERTLILDTQAWESVADLEICVSDNSNIHFDAATGRLYIGNMPQYSWIIYGWIAYPAYTTRELIQTAEDSLYS